ncbi:MAG TPA: VOC family protein [Acidimicrobiales bacterium]|nr:VOC family protein [Acidimicrobiales bacterium]
MPEMTSYEHGVPSWVDIGTADLAAGLGFYSELFGWQHEDQGEETGHYTIASKNGKQVAAISNAQDPGPPRWTTYVNVSGLDDVAAKVPAAGGTVAFGPTDVMTAGRMAIFSDPTGALIAAWQPGDHIGAQLVNEPGTFVWSELSSSDLEKSKAFYSEVFGWTWAGSEQYAEAQVSGRTVAGAMPRPADVPAEVPDHWLVYFDSAALDTDTARAVQLGATVVVEPREIPGAGRFSVVVDPQGALFGLYEG